MVQLLLPQAASEPWGCNLLPRPLQGGISSFFTPQLLLILQCGVSLTKKADLHHMELRNGWKLWGWRGFQQELAPGVLRDFLPVIEPLQEMIGCKGTHPHGGSTWLPPEAREP